jgi:hypothetical protein
MGIFSKVPYHYPNFSRLGTWKWNEEKQTWLLNLAPNAFTMLGMRITTQMAATFNDNRVEYSHLTGFRLGEIIYSRIKVQGKDGREYLAIKVDEHWREMMNAGKRIDNPGPRPYSIDNIPFEVETD